MSSDSGSTSLPDIIAITTAPSPAPASPAYVNWLVLFEYCSVFVNNTYSLYAFSRVLHQQLSRENRKNASPFLVLYLVAWISALLSGFVFITYQLLTWRPWAFAHDALGIYWAGVGNHIIAGVIPSTVFFLTINRILCIVFTVRYSEDYQRRLLYAAITVILVLLSLIGANFLIYHPTESNMGCQTITCIFNKMGTLELYTAVKVVGGAGNFFAGHILLARMWKMRKQLSGAYQQQAAEGSRRANMMALVAVATEFLFNFFPQFIVLIIGLFLPTLNVANYAGPYNIFFPSYDSLISGITYMRILIKRKVGPTSGMTVTHSHVNTQGGTRSFRSVSQAPSRVASPVSMVGRSASDGRMMTAVSR